MTVKWHTLQSVPRKIKGGGPQGATLGILEYISQSNNSSDCVDSGDRFKFVDDLTILEIVNLLTIGLSSYNIKKHVPSDIATHGQFIASEDLKSQDWLNQINNWTNRQQMIINQNKTKLMIFNYTEKYQFSTRLTLKGEHVEVIDSAKLLGTIITSDLKWEKNTATIVKKANARMELVRKVASHRRILITWKEFKNLLLK